MSEEKGAQEKSHEPTERRLQQAREKGDVPSSQDAQTAAAYLGLAAAMAAAGGWSAVSLGEALRPALAAPGDLARQALSGAGAEMVAAFAAEVGLAVLPLLVLPGMLVLGFLVASRGIVAAPQKIRPKLSRLSPIENAKNKYGPRGLVEFAKSAAKLTLIALVLGAVLAAESDRIAQYVRVEARLSGVLLGELFWAVFAGVMAVAVAIGLLDFFWQRHHHRSQNRMSHEELKEEGKEAEGDPHMKASRRERGRQIASNRMLLDVPGADVVITNPTHYAVALKWERTPGSAPRCVAKGVDELAAAIRTRAEGAGVPLHPDPPTARALHGLCEIGDEIPAEQFRAVAAAIVFADEVRRKRRAA